MTEKLRIALVGCGAISELHLMGITAGAPEIEVTAAVDPELARAEAVAGKTGAAAFRSLADALGAAEFDAVDLMVPHHLHESLALEAFAAGKHVLLEKPMGPTIEACERILAAARRAGTVFLVAENAQYWPEVLTVKRLIEEGAVGEVVTVRAALFIPPIEVFYGGETPWRMNRAIAGGGIAVDAGSHWIRPLRIWLGEVEEVVAALDRPFAKMEGESLVRALLRFRSGQVASFDALLTDAPLGPEVLFRITGAGGEITVEASGRVLVYDREHRKGRAVGQPGGYLDSYAGEFADFARAVLAGAPPAAGPEQALGELRAALAMYRSAESRRWEKVWE